MVKDLYVKTSQLQKLFTSAWKSRAEGVTFLHPCYLESLDEEDADERQRQAIMEALQEIGVGQCPKLVEQAGQNVHFREGESMGWKRTEGRYETRMFECSPEMAEIISEPRTHPATKQALLQIIDKHCMTTWGSISDY